tara:strand:+ start:187 stop:630 length:444 start_codon:yes stop_codon:yes gene_type:complete
MSCSKAPTFKEFLSKRGKEKEELKLEYNKYLELLQKESYGNKILNEKVLELLRKINSNNESIIPTVKYEKNTLKSYINATDDKRRELRSLLKRMKKESGTSYKSQEHAVINEEKKKQLSLKFSILSISIIVLILLGAGILIFGKNIL